MFTTCVLPLLYVPRACMSSEPLPFTSLAKKMSVSRSGVAPVLSLSCGRKWIGK